ncbi:MAG: NUDIX hydrolase [Sphingomonas bacterium]|nr:NUDIX hydrolase [Sphingomonas bacterium]
MEPPIPAATLIVIRAATAQPPDILVVERAPGMAFAGGAIVFPGGRLDPADETLATALGRPADALRITAIRETIEESAVLVGLRAGSKAIDPALGLILQGALLEGAAFATLLADHDLALDLDALTPFARWMPAFKQTRRFDTMFFIAAALPGTWPPRPQPGECQAAEWTGAQALLDRIAAGTDHAIFPTKRNLERLARFATFDETHADALIHSLDTIIPWVEERDGEPHVCLPADRGYPVTSEPLATAFRA